MKKLYRKGTVHPSPPIVSDHLSFLPGTILALAAALSLEDREVLAYLISCSNGNNCSFNLASRNTTTTTNNKKGSTDHAARFNCSCFRCYTSYWVRWDESPNREVIHEIIDAFEDELLSGQSSGTTKAAGSKCSKKERRNNSSNSSKRGKSVNGPGQGSEMSLKMNKKKDQLLVKPHKVEVSNSTSVEYSAEVGDEEDKGSVRRFVSFLGERLWGSVWNQ